MAFADRWHTAIVSRRVVFPNRNPNSALGNMQTYDFMMLAVLAATTLFGYRKGMAWQIASLASLVVSYFAALRFSEQLAPTFGNTAPLNRFVAMLVIYIVTSFLIWTLFRFVSGAIDKVKLESFDAQMGALIGAAKGVLLCVAITFFAVTLLPPAQGEAIVNSQSGRYIVALLDKSHSVFPPEIHQIIDPYVNKVEQRLNPNFQPHGNELQGLWPSQAQSQAPAQQTSWPTLPQLPQLNWPQTTPPSGQPATAPQQPQAGWPTSIPTGWPTLPQQGAPQPSQTNPYAPREPNPFPTQPYSAQGPSGRDY
jgi:membrane protein required for colicin V production